MTKVNVRHDAPIRVSIESSLPHIGKRSDIVMARLVPAHEAVLAIQHGKVSGYEGSAAPCKIVGIEVADESYVLKPGEFCTCSEPNCGGEDRPWPEGLK